MSSSVTLLDGSLGHELGLRGFGDRELWATHALLAGPDAVRQLHVDYIEAGAQVITTNTYSCVPLYLERRPGLIERAPELIELAARLADEARTQSGRPDVRIAASIPPVDESYRPDLVRSVEEMSRWYALMVEALAPSVDIWLCETMSSIAETLAAAEATAETPQPLWIAWTVSDDDPHRLRSGETLVDAVAAVAHLDPAALLVNCSIPDSVTSALEHLRPVTSAEIGGYANGFPPVPPDFNIETDLLGAEPPTAEQYALDAARWVEIGASIIGGCCDIGPSHIARLAAMLHHSG
ncbi:MAG: homocysteine S-methyltransferase family protein [Actinomycetota bacterium]|jgi:S-methylmethionine-dependent homocysteine/selenocysteine methylase|nr:homocysteine S-methyltransferase family protein [Actinomycetota bacterium]